MKCPVCKEVELVMSDRQGVEIDYCPTCRGVWLDRGELDKVIERSMDANVTGREGCGRREHDDDHDDHKGGFFGGRGGRRKSWLGELFD